MKVRYLKLKQWLLVSVMGVLGLSGCQSHKKVVAPDEEQQDVPQLREEEPIRLMYGVPTMSFRVSGRVTDAKGKPVRDLRVNMLERNMQLEGTSLVGDSSSVSQWLEHTEVRTDKDGRFTLENTGMPQEEVRLLVRDADGSKNGSFDDQVVSLPVAAPDLDRTEAHGMHQGTFRKEVQVKMREK